MVAKGGGSCQKQLSTKEMRTNFQWTWQHAVCIFELMMGSL